MKKLNKDKSCDDCSIRAIRSTESYRNSYCLIFECGQQDICPCRNCLLRVSCSEVCDERTQLRTMSVFTSNITSKKRMEHGT